MSFCNQIARHSLIKLKTGIPFYPLLLTFAFSCLLCYNNTASAQIAKQAPAFAISGKITSSSGGVLQGVTVSLKGSTIATTTSSYGTFKIKVPNGSGVLVFSFVGYIAREESINKRTTINIVLQQGQNALEDVVVIGYGTTKRKDLTGAVSSANVHDMALAPVKSFDEALQGRIAGVEVTSNDGQPGTNPNIVIRGANSLTQDNSPLYVVDGFPIENYDNNSLNPLDIETIDVLKDASATAIYGARGANGVIIITTKRGKSGPPVVTYDGSYGINRAINNVKLLSPYDFVKLQLEFGGTAATTTYLTSENKTLEDYKNVPGIDWTAKVLQPAHVQNHSLSISGGNAKSRYSISGSILDQQGVFVNTGFKRYQGRVTLDQQINSKLKVGLNANYSNTNGYGTIATQGNGTTLSLMASLWSYRPVLTSTNPTISEQDLEESISDPIIVQTADYRTNPLVQLENELRQALSANLLANAYAEYTIKPGLRLRVTGGMSSINNQNNAFNNSKTRTGGPGFVQSLGPNGSEVFNNVTNLTNENTLTYSRLFKNVHTINILAGYTQQTNKSSRYGASAIQLPNESLGLSGLDEGTPQAIQSANSSWGVQSFLGRINYSYLSKYLFTASWRADGSSKLMQNNRWGYFPSAALAYRLSAEEFMKKVRFVSDAKIRVSYGVTGNNRVSDFAYLSTLSTTSSSGYAFDASNPLRGTYPGVLGNPDLKWESTKQFNTGMDVEFFGGRLAFTVDYYYKKTDNLLLNAQLPYSTGYVTAFKNIGSISNRGLELTLNSINVAGKSFRWATNFNIFFNRSKVLALTENQESLTSVGPGVFGNNAAFIAKLGQPVSQFYGVIFDGLYQYEDFDKLTNGTYILKANLPANGNTRVNIKPGDAKYHDLNNDGLITLSDYTVIGNPNPDFTGGFNNNFGYKGFDLNVFIQFCYGNDILNANRAVFENLNVSNQNQYATYAKRWSPDNTTSNIPRYGGSGQNLYTTRLIENGSYYRLKTVSLGYNLPVKYLSKAKVKSLRVYVSAQNLYTKSSYSGTDPEVSTRNTTLTPGFDWSPYPRAKTIVFGLDLSF